METKKWPITSYFKHCNDHSSIIKWHLESLVMLPKTNSKWDDVNNWFINKKSGTCIFNDYFEIKDMKISMLSYKGKMWGIITS